jgi:hypothetical protein
MEHSPGEDKEGNSDKSVQIHLHERRRYPRVPCKSAAEALVMHHEALFRGEIRDISQGGCFIGTRALLQIETGAEIDLRFSLRGVHYSFDAVVASVRDGKGFGLKFLRAGDAESVEALAHLLQELTEPLK